MVKLLTYIEQMSLSCETGSERKLCSDRIFNVALAQHDQLIAKNKSQNSLERETIIHFLFELKILAFYYTFSVHDIVCNWKRTMKVLRTGWDRKMSTLLWNFRRIVKYERITRGQNSLRSLPDAKSCTKWSEVGNNDSHTQFSRVRNVLEFCEFTIA